MRIMQQRTPCCVNIHEQIVEYPRYDLWSKQDKDIGLDQAGSQSLNCLVLQNNKKHKYENIYQPGVIEM